MMPYMDSMLKNMLNYLESNDPSMEGHQSDMQDMMSNMDQMLEASRNVMSTMHGMHSGTDQTSASEHEGHGH
ncbi:hypothetical protein GW813_03450 [bacterium]|nr:hypothetical protein [bacterium]